MSSSDVFNFPCNGYSGVDFNVYLGGYKLAWSNENLPAVDSDGKDITATTKLLLDYGIMIRPDISEARAQDIDLRGLPTAWYDCHQDTDLTKMYAGNFPAGYTILKGIFTMHRKNIIRTRNLGRPVSFEAWFSLNDTKFDLNPESLQIRGYNNYTLFASNKSNPPESTDTLETIPTVEVTGTGSIKNYIAGIFSTSVDIRLLATNENSVLTGVTAAVRYIKNSGKLEIILKGKVVASAVINDLKSISGNIDATCRISSELMGTNKSNVAAITVIANGQPSISFNADWDIFLPNHNLTGLINTYMVKQGFYVDANRGTLDNSISYSLCPMMTMPYFPIPINCCSYPCYLPNFTIDVQDCSDLVIKPDLPFPWEDLIPESEGYP
jgi:hypothetical protein